jgi:hypothetical protein
MEARERAVDAPKLAVWFATVPQGDYNPTMRVLVIAAALWLAVPARGVEITLERARELAAALPQDDPWEKTKCASALAWGEAGLCHALIDLYEASGDMQYLREMVRRGDRMLSHRDDRRGVTDSSGKIHKAWSMATKYTVGEGVLVDAAGKPSIRLRSVPFAYNNQTQVEVSAGATDRNFSIIATNAYWQRKETFADLSLDPASPRYFAKVINNPAPVPHPTQGECGEASCLIRARAAAETIAPPTAQKLEMTSLPLAYTGYLGVIYYPLLRFSEMVRREPALQELALAATRFVTAADESYDEYQTEFRNGPAEDEGYYLCCERGGAFPYDNIGEPFNYLGCHVSCELILHRMTGKPVYLDHVQRMARLFKRRLRQGPNDTYVWNYWYEPMTTTGWTGGNSPSDNYPSMAPRPIVEDASHGQLDVLLVVNAAKAGIELDETDVRRLANTFLRSVVKADRSGLNAQVDGTAGAAKLENASVAGWILLSDADPAVYEACREVYLKRNRDELYALARLVNWEKRLKLFSIQRGRT